MRVAFRDNDGKGRMIADALEAAGHELTDEDADVAVVDHCYLHPDLLDRYPGVLYPHGGGTILDYDGHLPFHPNVRVMLVHGPGESEVHAAYGLPVPTVPVGWSYSPIAAPCYPTGIPRTVLFAPAHPSVGGYLPDYLAEANWDTQHMLVDLGLDVTVRLWPGADIDGHHLDWDLPVTWTWGRGLAYGDIDAADLVVADNGTVAHLALARGVPLVMIGSREPQDLGHNEPRHPAHWATYAELMAYPFDLVDGPDVVENAAHPSAVAVVEDYRRRFVGGPFDPAKAVAAIEEAAA